MEPRKQVPKTKNGIGAGLFCALMILFIIFEIVLLAVVLVRAYSPSEKPKLPPVEQAPPADDPDDDPKPTVPVFSGGVLPAVPTANSATVTLSNEIFSQYAILIDAETGEILAGKDAHTTFSPASMTKVMTLIVACEALSTEDLERRLAFDEEIYAYITSGSYVGTSPSLPTESGGYSCFGDTYRIKDLLYGIGVASAADCTYMIVKEVAGTEEAFVALMNQKAQELGLTNTHFDNAVGFDSEGNYTTAAEMAIIMNYAMQCELIVEVLSKQASHIIYAQYYDEGVEKSYKVTLSSSWASRLEKYPSFHTDTTTVKASKTGYTDQSFMTVMAQSKNGAGRYILVLGNRTSSANTISEKFRQTMVDIEYLLNTYVS